MKHSLVFKILATEVVRMLLRVAYHVNNGKNKHHIHIMFYLQIIQIKVLKLLVTTDAEIQIYHRTLYGALRLMHQLFLKNVYRLVIARILLQSYKLAPK